MRKDDNAKEQFLKNVWPKVKVFMEEHGQGKEESWGYNGGKGWPGPYIWSEDGDVKRIITGYCEEEFGKESVHNESKIDKFMFGERFQKFKNKHKELRHYSIDIDMTHVSKCVGAAEFKKLKHDLFIEVKYLGTDAMWGTNKKAKEQFEKDCQKLQWLTEDGFCEGAIAIFIGEGRKKQHIDYAFVEDLKGKYPKVEVLVWQRKAKVNMKEMKKQFKKDFGISMPPEMLPKAEVFELEEMEGQKCFVVASRAAAASPYLVQGSIDDFFRSCPEGYFLTGYWGHGVNSYAFYYQCIDSWSKVFFRLGYGGAYEDSDEDARIIREFLPKYFDFEKKVGGKVRSLSAMESMGEGWYKIVDLKGRVFDVKESLLRKPDFDKKFGDLLGRLK